MPEAFGRLAVGAFGPGGLHQRLAPHLTQEGAQEVRHRHRRQGALQLDQVALLGAQIGLLGLQHGDRALVLNDRLGLLRDERFQLGELRRIQIDLVEIAIDDLLDQGAHLLDEFLAWPVVEVVEGAGQRGDAVDETAHRVLARGEKRRVDQRHAQHRQLQPRDLPGHLRRHPGVGEDLVEQAAHDVDHHVVELAGGGLHQLLAVGADQVDRHQARRCVFGVGAGRTGIGIRAGADAVQAATARAGSRRFVVTAKGRWPLATATQPSTADASNSTTNATARLAGQARQPPQQRHQVRVLGR